MYTICFKLGHPKGVNFTENYYDACHEGVRKTFLYNPYDCQGGISFNNFLCAHRNGAVEE